jgi:hypothetical protein
LLAQFFGRGFNSPHLHQTSSSPSLAARAFSVTGVAAMWTQPDLILGVAFMIACALTVLVGAALAISALALFLSHRLLPHS